MDTTNKEKNPEDFYNKLRKQLEEVHTWPTTYLFKFIIPADLEKFAEVEKVFDDTEALISTRDSSKGKYTGVTVKVPMKDPDDVIKRYKEVSKIEGIVSL
jgi:hypothetical protein